MNCLNKWINNPLRRICQTGVSNGMACGFKKVSDLTGGGHRQQRGACRFSLTKMHLRLLLARPPLLCSSSLLWGLVERLDSRWQGPTPPPVMNGGWCHLALDRHPCMYTKEASASGVKLRACSWFLRPHDISLMVEAGFMCRMIFA